MSSDKKNIVLEVRSLTVGYKNRKEIIEIKKNIDFNLFEGELVSVVGANGVGKSTLLRTITKVQPKLFGHILIKGKDLSQFNSLELASELSMVLTEQIPSKNLTVLEVVALGRQPYTNWIGKLTENDLTKIQKAVSLVSLQEIQNKKCYELSDGQLQKVMIARALAQDTSLIVLDEPTTHLDIYHKAYILKLLRKIAHETKKTILFSSHEIDLAIQLCDKILVMDKSKMYYNDPCKHIEDGNFNNLFPNSLIQFDKKSGTFKIVKSKQV